jgi:hypothetical protein
MANIQLGEAGTVLEVLFWDDANDQALDISGASTKQILVYRGKHPGTLEHAYAGSFATDGTDGKLRAVTGDPSELDAAGPWQIRGIVVLSGRTIPTERGSFVVES